MKKRMSTIIGALVVLCLATSCFVGSTFAKYTSTVKGEGEVTTDIAKWAFDIGSLTDLTNPEAQTVTFSTGTVTNTGTTEDKETILVDSNKVKMAPGSKGSFSLDITNKSDVTAKVKATITSVSLTITPKDGGEAETVTTHPFKYSASESGTYETISDSGLVICSEEEINYAADSNKKTINIYWDWAFAENDTVDTQIGIAQANGDTITWTVNVEVVLTQVD